MKERPILFTGDNVRAILEGRKTQTRRVIVPQPAAHWMNDKNLDWSKYYVNGKKMLWIQHPDHAKRPSGKQELECPYGKPGDRLWVREAIHVLTTETEGVHRCDPRVHFRNLWDSINSKRAKGKYAWAKNPWVWVIAFRRVP